MTMIRTSGLRCTTGPWLGLVTALGIELGTVSCTTADVQDDSHSVAIGLVLPFTGVNAGTSANFERAAIYATSRVNAAGGIRGKRLRLVEADSHSSVLRSLESAKRFEDEGVVVVIGAENSDIAAAIEPVLLENGVAFLSPLVGSADDSLVNCADLWFRLAPAASTLGEALAKQLSADLATSVVILSETDAYSRAFGDAVSRRFESLNGQVVLRLELDSTTQSYDNVVDKLVDSGVSNVVLAASPRTAALVVNEFDAVTRTPPNWYLSPLLKTDLLVQNVSPAALNGARGVAPKIYETRDTFRLEFQDRWAGDHPLEGAYFYYDAIALVALALQVALPTDAGAIAPEVFKQSVLDSAETTGEVVTWNTIESGLRSSSAGKRVYYSGLTGPMVLNQCGARKIGTYSTWKVEGGKIVDDDATN